MREISESDWKILRKLHRIALDRFCQQVLDDLGQFGSVFSETPHQRYLTIYEQIQARNDEMAEIFDDLRRSRAFICIAALRSRGLITAAEYAAFSKEMRNAIDSLIG